MRLFKVLTMSSRKSSTTSAKKMSQRELKRRLRPSKKPREPVSSLHKMLSVLDLFTPSEPVWSTNDIIAALGTSRSTAYRYIRGLHEIGLLGAVGNGFYVLGPRIIELDLQIRSCDPLYRAGKGVLEQLVKETSHSALLCMLFSSSLLCIAEHRAPSSKETLFSRGQRRPLFRGAMSKIILPYLPSHRLRNIYTRNQKTIADAALGRSWEEFKEALSKIRRDGYAMTYGEFNPGIIGIAAPVFNSERLVIGSVGVAWRKKRASDGDLSRIIASVQDAANEITRRIAKMTDAMAMPPRAVG